MNWMTLLAVIVSVPLFYLTGHYWCGLLKIKPYSDHYATTFVKIVVGMLFCVFICAAICTRGNTILLGIPLVAALCYFNNRENDFSFNLPQKTELLPLALILLFVVFIFGYQAYNFYSEPYNNMPYIDYGFYGVAGRCMVQHHTESVLFVTNIYSDSNAASPYHYFDIWMGCLYSIIFRVNNVESLYVIVYPLLLAFYAFSIIVIARIFTRNVFIQMFSLLTLFFYPLAWFDFSISISDILFTPNFLGTHSLVCPKNLVIALFFFLSFVVYQYNYRNTFLSLLLVPIASTITAPAFFMAVSIILCITFLLKRNERMVTLVSACFVIVVAVFVFGFYFLQPKGLNTGGYSIDLSAIVCTLKSTCKLIIYLCIFHLPLLVAFTFPLIRKRQQFIQVFLPHFEWFSFVIILLISGFLFAQINQGKTDANQFYTSVILILPLIYEICFLGLLQLTDKIWLKSLACVLALCLCAYSGMITKNNTLNALIRKTSAFPYDDMYIYNVQSTIHKLDNKVGASLKDSYFYFPYYYYNNNNTMVETSCISKKCIDNDRYSFASFCRNKKEPYSLEQLQYEFVIENNIRFIIIEKKEQLPEIFLPLVDTVFTDSKTGEQFAFLKP